MCSEESPRQKKKLSGSEKNIECESKIPTYFLSYLTIFLCHVFTSIFLLHWLAPKRDIQKLIQGHSFLELFNWAPESSTCSPLFTALHKKNYLHVSFPLKVDLHSTFQNQLQGRVSGHNQYCLVISRGIGSLCDITKALHLQNSVLKHLCSEKWGEHKKEWKPHKSFSREPDCQAGDTLLLSQSWKACWVYWQHDIMGTVGTVHTARSSPSSLKHFYLLLGDEVEIRSQTTT